MKTQLTKISITIFSLLFSLTSTGEIITAIIKNGSWTKSTTWDHDRLPIQSDTIIIPSGIEVKVKENVNFELSSLKSSPIYLIVSGGLNIEKSKFINLPINSSIYLTKHSSITLDKSSSFISVHLEKICFDKTKTINGTERFGSHSNSLEDIRNFELINNENSFLVSWSLREGFESGYYEIQVSRDGLKWEIIQQEKIVSDSVELQYQHLFKNCEKSFFIKLVSYDLKGRKQTLATTKFSKKKNYDKIKTILPKILIGATILTYLNHLNFNK